MRSFGQTMRNCLPAVGLGLISAFGVASVAVIAAPQAVAQTKTSKEFAEPLNAANAAFAANRYAEALQKAGEAEKHADNNQQKSWVEQIRAGVYCAQKNWAACISSIEKARGFGGIAAQTNQNYDKQLYGAYQGSGQTAKANAQLKANVAKYGGTADELAVIAKNELAAKNYAEAIKLAEQAIAKSGGKPKNVPYNILLNAYDAQGKKEEFYKTLERAATVFKSATYWKPFIERAKAEPKFRSGDAGLDVFRALSEAGVPLSDADKFEWGKQALSRGYAIEAEKVWTPLFKAGTYGGASDKSKDQHLRDYALAQAEAKKDRESGLKADETVAAASPSGIQYASLGEAYHGAGDYTLAVDMFQKAIAKGNMDATALDLVRLRLGIAQWKAGKKDDARKTWAAVKADNGAAWLAKSWLALAKS